MEEEFHSKDENISFLKNRKRMFEAVCKRTRASKDNYLRNYSPDPTRFQLSRSSEMKFDLPAENTKGRRGINPWSGQWRILLCATVY